MNLWNLTEEYIRITNMTDDDSIDEQTIKDTLELLNYEIEEKADNYSRLIAQLESDCDTLDNYITKAKTKKDKKSKIIKYLKDNLLMSMQQLNKDCIKTDLFNIKVATNGGLAPLEIEEEKVPVEYKKIKYEIDNAKIREDLEKGLVLPFARITERGKRISIK